MPKTATATPTFADLAQRHGKALAYIAGSDTGNTVPADPTAATPAELVQLARDAVDTLNHCRFWNWAEAMEDVAIRLDYAHQAEDDAARTALLQGAGKALRSTAYDAACELADANGDPRDF
ncbi:hypothetical protein ABZX88_33735 [Kitasatospora aureofaciens]|uniref:hypothetical protein n=1 Tax=Kitasatospora aureofaciens TaxID=1894 RepID=UPI0033A754E8